MSLGKFLDALGVAEAPGGVLVQKLISLGHDNHFVEAQSSISRILADLVALLRK